METVNEFEQRPAAESVNPDVPSTPAEPNLEASTSPEELGATATPANNLAEEETLPSNVAASDVSAISDDEEEVVARPPRKRGRATKGAAKPARERLPDPGDGSGYAAPYMPEGVDSPDEPLWYVIHCYSGYENKVKQNLEQFIESMGMADRILEVVVPTEDEIEVREGKRQTVERRVFPGYILVRMKMSEETWQVVRNTPGVTRFVGMGNRPQPLSQQEVDQILRRMQAEAPKIKVNFRTGQKVRITDGPFADFMGIVDKIDTERAKVTVLVSFFGRETPVELDFLQVERM
jgi:transcriptional antiterminator NusG